MEEKTYECKECGNTIKTSDAKVPECCNNPMVQKKLDPCTQPAHAEHSRPMDSEDACNDFRSG